VLFNGGPLTPAASPSPPASPTAPGSSDAKQLESLLPNKLGGHAVVGKRSMTGSDWVVQEQDQAGAALVNWLSSFGESLDYIQVATGGLPDNSALPGGLTITAFRVNGVDHTTLLSTLQRALASRAPLPTWTTTTLGGKRVQEWRKPTYTEYLYGTRDVLFIVSVADQATAIQALAALP